MHLSIFYGMIHITEIARLTVKKCWQVLLTWWLSLPEVHPFTGTASIHREADKHEVILYGKVIAMAHEKRKKEAYGTPAPEDIRKSSGIR